MFFTIRNFYLLGDERMNKLTILILTMIIMHILIWVGTLGTMFVLWKIFQPNTYFIIERITMISSILGGICVSIFDTNDL